MAIGVSYEIRVSTPQRGTSVSMTDSTELALPADDFVTGAVAGRSLGITESAGSLSFTVTTKYAHAAAVRTWVYRVSVDGVVYARWDGGGDDRPVKVRIEGLDTGSEIALEVAALKSRAGYHSWSKATRAHVKDLRFKEGPKPPLGALSVVIDPRDEHYEPDTSNGVHRVDISAIPTLGDNELVPHTPRQLAVTTDHGVLPLLVVRRPGATGVVVLSNGAVDLQRSASTPVFQRSSWWQHIDAHQIYVCDPGTAGSGALSLSWGQLTEDYWAVPDLARTVQALSSVLGVSDARDRLYFGSSAGGFLSLGMAAHDDGCRVVVNNAQFDWTRWMAGAVNRLRAARFGNALPADLRAKYPHRTDVLNLLGDSRGGPSSVSYLVNLASRHDSAVDAVRARRFLRENPEYANRFRIIGYRDEAAGHNPLPQPQTLAWINAPAVIDPAAVDPMFSLVKGPDDRSST